jgi:segregation and condensation protein A
VSAEYRVQLDVFSGPLDLLLYLIRRDELDIQDVSIRQVTDQYCEYVKLLQSVDPNTVGDFLVLASTLIEMKSRALLPSPPLEALEDEQDPRSALVRQLLEYKRFKDAARSLGRAADDRALRYVRQPADLPRDLAGVELEDVEVWDLLAAFGRVMAAIGKGPGVSRIRLDETPIEEYAENIVELLTAQGTASFVSLFERRADRAEIVGLFLALLELVRNRRVRAQQDRLHGEICLFLLIAEADEPATAETETP